MKKTILFIIPIILFGSSIFAQETRLDSLFQELKTVQEDTLKINLFVEIGNVYYRENPDSAIYYFEKALLISEQIENINFQIDVIRLNFMKNWLPT